MSVTTGILVIFLLISLFGWGLFLGSIRVNDYERQQLLLVSLILGLIGVFGLFFTLLSNYISIS